MSSNKAPKYERVVGHADVVKMVEAAQATFEDQPSPLPVLSNVEGDAPEGYDLMAVPLNKRTPKLGRDGKQEINDKGKPLTETVTTALLVAHVPTVNHIAQTTDGMKFVEEAVLSRLATRLNNNVKSVPEGASAEEIKEAIPSTLAEWIETSTADGIGKLFDDYAKPFVKSLRGKGFSTMTDAIYRRCLRDASYATAQYEKIGNQVWEHLLDKAIADFKAAGNPTATLEEWKENRNKRQAVEVESIDSLDDLGI